MTHCNIPIFIPHVGCPHQCVFCNQRTISGQADFCEEDIPRQIEESLKTLPQDAEVELAYFGGSFTGIEIGRMERLLQIADGYRRSGRVHSIRVSTRPDRIDGERLSLLKRYGVDTVELGLQSMDDEVLVASGRGHTAKEAREACRAVREAGFSLVGQMMIGLPRSTPESERATAREICRMGAEACRIYPTVVFRETPLAEMTRRGDYQPISTEEAVARSADVLQIFLDAGVTCLRIGLCASEALVSPDHVLGGANHPALGELVWNEIYYSRLVESLSKQGLLGRDVELILPKEQVSKVVGQNRRNLIRLYDEYKTNVRKVRGTEDARGITAVPFEKKPNEGEHQPCI